MYTEIILTSSNISLCKIRRSPQKNAHRLSNFAQAAFQRWIVLYDVQ